MWCPSPKLKKPLFHAVFTHCRILPFLTLQERTNAGYPDCYGIIRHFSSLTYVATRQYYSNFLIIFLRSLV